MSLVPSLFGRKSSVFDPFSLEVWDPLGAFNSITRDLPLSEFARDAAAIASTQIDWKETSDAHIFKADLPGLKQEEVKIEVEDGRILQISGERNKEEEQKNEKYHRVERSRGKFLRRFRLPENAKMEEVKAAMENGVLTVTVPKQPEPKPKVKSIEISG
ncbi:18.1 kDa class I heat shock protein [Cryptomeria japonica]|uniref:18.1 kDa class I heat shock protein n=1 Tax=Cryptomeria japonica TaxID=3369 RepID=UPI0027DA179F|nr:18.1 kDa class I heat shock protein [Cryptomeria japonica]